MAPSTQGAEKSDNETKSSISHLVLPRGQEAPPLRRFQVVPVDPSDLFVCRLIEFVFVTGGVSERKSATRKQRRTKRKQKTLLSSYQAAQAALRRRQKAASPWARAAGSPER